MPLGLSIEITPLMRLVRFTSIPIARDFAPRPIVSRAAAIHDVKRARRSPLDAGLNSIKPSGKRRERRRFRARRSVSRPNNPREPCSRLARSRRGAADDRSEHGSLDSSQPDAAFAEKSGGMAAALHKIATSRLV
jgi:hypothetical protein